MSYLQVYIACLTAVGWMSPAQQTDKRFQTCLAVGLVAEMEDVDATLAVALSFTESRFNADAVSTRGARGPLQIVPRFHCPGGKAEGCDLITAGLRAMKKYRKKYKSWPEALCHWASGNKCYRRSRRFARVVLKRRRALSCSQGDPR